MYAQRCSHYQVRVRAAGSARDGGIGAGNDRGEAWRDEVQAWGEVEAWRPEPPAGRAEEKKRLRYECSPGSGLGV